MSCPPTTLIIIGDVVVQQDAHGRYSLNYLHRAAGGEPRHQPSNFLRNDSTRGLIAELTCSSDSMNGPVESVRGGTIQGTFVSRPLVYAYAMWVSPAFHLRVIEVFDTVARGVPVPGAAPSFPVLKSLAEALRLAADLAEANERQAAQFFEQQRLLEAQSPAVKLADDFLVTTRLMSLMDTARHLQLPIRCRVMVDLSSTCTRFVPCSPLTVTLAVKEDHRHAQMHPRPGSRCRRLDAWRVPARPADAKALLSVLREGEGKDGRPQQVDA